MMRISEGFKTNELKLDVMSERRSSGKRKKSALKGRKFRDAHQRLTTFPRTVEFPNFFHCSRNSSRRSRKVDKLPFGLEEIIFPERNQDALIFIPINLLSVGKNLPNHLLTEYSTPVRNGLRFASERQELWRSFQLFKASSVKYKSFGSADENFSRCFCKTLSRSRFLFKLATQRLKGD